MDQQKLSLVAQYDDLVRLTEQLIGGDLLESKIRLLLEDCEKQRLLCLLERNEILESRETIKLLKKEINSLKTNLKFVRESYIKELNLKEKIQNENTKLIKKLTQVQQYLLEDDSSSKDSKSSLREQLFSSFNLNKLTTIEEKSNSDLSLSDLEFDKTEDDILGQNKQFDDDFSITTDDMVTDEPLPTKQTIPLTKSLASIQGTNKLSAFSQSLMKQRQLQNDGSIKIDNRPHCFVVKKNFRPEKCGPCGGSIGFCSTSYHCRDCRAICHTTCKDKVPLPCIPYVSRANIGKQGRLILISDFVPSNCKPCVPALIIHCTNEIERRGLDEVGIYRVPGSEKEVKDLQEKILKAKNGIPQLSDVDVHVLCNVVKKFLNHLDEALISRIAWRDFVEAANISNEDERKIRFKEAIVNLPNTNRDTLAFLMLHLRKVADEIENKMTISSLAKIFGPTVLGYSMRDPPSSQQMFEENKKQIQVVEYLLNLDNEFWQTIGDFSQNNFSFINRSDQSALSYLSAEQHKPSIRNCPSIGSRLYGGKIDSGTITPLKINRSKTNRNYNFKSLF